MLTSQNKEAANIRQRGGVSACGTQMQDMQTHLEKLRSDAAECVLIRDLATDAQKRELFARLAEHLSALADDVEHAIEVQRRQPSSGDAP
jgi:hypothetical protein